MSGYGTSPIAKCGACGSTYFAALGGCPECPPEQLPGGEPARTVSPPADLTGTRTLGASLVQREAAIVEFELSLQEAGESPAVAASVAVSRTAETVPDHEAPLDWLVELFDVLDERCQHEVLELMTSAELVANSASPKVYTRTDLRRALTRICRGVRR